MNIFLSIICFFLFIIYRKGACGVLVAHPLDTIKTWQQASNTSVLTAVQQIYTRNNGVSEQRVVFGLIGDQLTMH